MPTSPLSEQSPETDIRRLFPADTVVSGLFPSLPLSVEERISAACFSKTSDKWLAVFSKTKIIIYDTT